ncbi:putative sucrose transporter [Aspergillus vadensis CBS 113365]|uniref:Sucrose transporter n=1 Tax=Aspergillus vadensis (strain CBS 113365 / IMI 142717 / IBT 24658) TaxID=1448311 RepID=A0A319AWX6_ASPVC|nr:sucrose transporter [Aspergillus vadensis CBS 113365]PYH63871.1 sucrose transporter [Aspergillus vadensis CBS 113365]
MTERSNEAEPLIRDGWVPPDSHVPPGASPDEASKSSAYLFILSLAMGGLQIVYSIQHSSGSPYLLSLGMSKALLAFVWIAGPLTGTLVQPYIGIRSDNCRISWGKRKPFMVFGGVLLAICLLALAWVRELVGGLFGLFGLDAQAGETKTAVIVAATLLMYCQDFAINTVQAASRAFIVDNAPAHQQEAANAWASRHVSAGNIFGFIIGGLNLPNIVPFLGNTQFKGISVIASVSLAITLSIGCAYIKEKDPRMEPSSPASLGFVSLLQSIRDSVHRLPFRIRQVYIIQAAAWFGWFSFLFYATTYIGQLYVNPIFEKHQDLSDDEINKLWEDATRIGTLAMLVNALVSFAASIILPMLVVPSERQTAAEANTSSSSLRLKLRIPGLSLRRAWLLSHCLFAICMFSTFFVSSPGQASVMTGVIGIAWAVTAWAPYALIASEIAQEDPGRPAHRREGSGEVEGASILPYVQESDEPRRTEEKSVNQAGVVLGLHNVAISFPQIISSAIGSLIFKALQKPRGQPWDTSTSWVMRLGGCAAILAACLTMGLHEQSRRK